MTFPIYGAAVHTTSYRQRFSERITLLPPHIPVMEPAPHAAKTADAPPRIVFIRLVRGKGADLLLLLPLLRQPCRVEIVGDGKTEPRRWPCPWALSSRVQRLVSDTRVEDGYRRSGSAACWQEPLGGSECAAARGGGLCAGRRGRIMIHGETGLLAAWRSAELARRPPVG